ncbi:DUF6351 family protein [Variovorax sp. J22R24]|uniref:DUF6351 family protein n=1 Tax=Variovorax gracilis TaxID=3053502 RepID=UPI002574F409|nr:DUF6351 family protein [Variovorax sp. J22R24]MDM0109356.1 DUF6351 family protein [Variovorax sp. J22R24]
MFRTAVRFQERCHSSETTQMQTNPSGRWVLAAATIGVSAAVLVACGGGDHRPLPIVDSPPAAATRPVADTRTLSNRADLISDGDALVEIVVPNGTDSSGLNVSVDGRDVTSAFAKGSDRRITGLIAGLAIGNNVVVAKTKGTRAAKLTITNVSRGGPVFSGAQPTPFVCATPTPARASGNNPATNASGLSTAATDAQCNIATETKLWYKTNVAGCNPGLPDPSPSVLPTATNPPQTGTPPANPCFKPYTVGTTPADLAMTTTDNGATVPYIVRVERGTMNRGLYDIAVLFDPSKSWSANSAQPQWNGKVLYQFGASTGQPRRQLRPAPSWTDDRSLSRGYLVVQNSMTDSLQNSNRVMMTETVMMMKEHIIDTYGSIKFTMGSGCSGGSINSHMNMSIAPNLIDGFTVSCAFPDSETTGIEVGDCVTLVEAYQKPAWLNLMAANFQTQAQINAKKAAINGHEDQTAYHGWMNLFGSNAKAGNYFARTIPPANNATGVIVQSATETNNCQLPASQVYDAVTNPTGPRCNAWSWAESIFGKANATQANDTRDNVGVQYGLKALRNGSITAEEFVTLNEIVGGVDRDSNLMANRNSADTALAPGSFLTGIHHVRSFAIRDRLDRDAGGHDNQVMWRFGLSGFIVPPGTMASDAFLTMDKWLTNLKADTSTAAIEQKVKSSKPAEAFDYCVLSTDAAQSTKVTDKSTCDADPLLNPESSPRQVAGGPRAEDILKCQLKAIDPADYAPVTLTGGQLGRLQAVFPTGVCDWSKPGVSQQAAVSPLTFKSGPGGQAMPQAPSAVAAE